MYDENKWNEVNNENEKKNNEQPVNTQNTQNTQNGAQQPQGEHTGRRSTEDLVPVHRTVSRITEIRTARTVTTAGSSITETRTSTRTRISSTTIIRDMDRIRTETETATTLRRNTPTPRRQLLSRRQRSSSVSYPAERCTESTVRPTPCCRTRAPR